MVWVGAEAVAGAAVEDGGKQSVQKAHYMSLARKFKAYQSSICTNSKVYIHRNEFVTKPSLVCNRQRSPFVSETEKEMYHSIANNYIITCIEFLLAQCCKICSSPEQGHEAAK